MKSKAILFAICISMIFVLFIGCNQTASTTTTTTAAQTTTQVETQPPEPSPVKVFLSTSRNETEFSDEVKEEILRLTNVQIEYLRAPADQWKQKLTLALSSGEIYDIMVMDPPTYFEYAPEGVFYDITDEFAKYGGLVKYVPDDAKARMSVGGRLYCVPAMNVAGKYVFCLRGDWLEAVGKSAPKDLDEFEEVMRAFTEDDPDGNNKNDTYGYGNNLFHPIYGAFGVFPEYYTEVNGKISTNSISENYKKALMFINQLYEKKYIDPEIFIMKSEQYGQKFINSQVGSLTEWWSFPGVWLRDYAFMEINPKGEILVADPPVGPDGQSGMAGRDNIQSAVCIHNESKYKEAALTLLDFFTSDYGYRVGKYGVEGIGWSWDGTKVTYFIGGSIQKDLKGRTNKYDEAFCFMQRMDIFPEQLEGDDPTQMAFHDSFVKAAEGTSLILNAFIGLTTDEFVEKTADIQAYENDWRIKFILGEASFDDWDEYVKGWKDIGGEEVRQSLLKAYNEQYFKSYTFLEQ